MNAKIEKITVDIEEKETTYDIYEEETVTFIHHHYDIKAYKQGKQIIITDQRQAELIIFSVENEENELTIKYKRTTYKLDCIKKFENGKNQIYFKAA